MLALYITLSILAILVLTVLLLYLYALPVFVAKKITSADNPDGEMTYPENFDDMQKDVKVIKDLKYQSAYPSNEYDLYIPTKKVKCPLIIWAHGGGFIAGTKDGGVNVMTALCSGGYAVASINYAVAPKHHYPTAIKQIGEFTTHILSREKDFENIDFSRIIYGGDSAGAQLAAQYVAAQTNADFAKQLAIKQVLTADQIKACLLVCGPFNLIALREFAKQNNKKLAFFVSLWGRAYFGMPRWYASKRAKQTIVANSVTNKFPPTFLTDGNDGSFEIQNRKLAQALRDKGVTTEELYFDETACGKVPHEYLFNLADEKSMLCMDKMISFLQNILSQ